MRSSSVLHLAMAFAAVASLSACNCQRRAAQDTPIAELQPCNEDERCETGLCDSANGRPKACLRPCGQGCRGADICTLLSPGRYACVPEKAGLCKTCESDADCPQVADRCLVLGTTRYCGRDCSFDDTCPPTFRCGEANTVGGLLAPKQCQPSSGTCDCIASTAGQQVPCDVTNNSGRCTGVSVCRPPLGYDACTARTPTAEVCNNIDDDCNGQTDENLGDLMCGQGECRRAAAACANGTPQTCTPGLPSNEVCNGRDDDCDGTVDNGFDTQTNVAHCGACNTACVLTNAVPKCEMGGCAIERCVAGWSDLDRVASNGCEYPCLPTDGGVEVCDGIDNDCNGIVDDGFNLLSDPTNCGQCNLVCSVPGTSIASYACVARVCGIGACVPGRGNCNQQYGDGCEVDLTNTVGNCGLCGNACVTPNATPACVGSACAIAVCAPGFANCNGQVADGCEVNTLTSLSNCGACGNACSASNANSTCTTGVCGFTCQANWWDADGQAANGCEYACVRTNGGVEACDGIDNNCDNRIDEGFDLTSNASHCGLCNRACAAPFATTTCSASNCGITACDPARANCNNLYVDGCEVNTNTSLSNCGACNNVCTTPNATPACNTGTCAIASCNTGFANCNTVTADGCEVNTNSNLAHCGACNNACATANGSPACLGGTCAVGACNPNFANCNNLPADGCEVNTGSNLNHCGACNAACTTPNATPQCLSGTCGIQSCNTGFTNCNGAVADGCEVNTGSDLNNCGGCNTVCSTPNATPRCTTGACGIQTCNVGFANCNGQVSDGCEVNTTNSLANCGGCGAVCAPANAVPMCASGTCSVGACLPGFYNLNGLVADGCEYACVITNGGVEACDGIDNNCNGQIDETFVLASDVNNCGACGNVCSAPNVTVPRCTASVCGVQQCANNFANCNGAFADGCEVNTSTSLANCGACGSVCSTPNATPVCTASSCQVLSCTGTWRNCNNLPVDGCEINISNDVNNCNGCGTVCNTPNAVNACTTGSCTYTCPANRWDLDGNAANGCEYSCTFLSATDEPDLGLVDANCDGIDGEVNNSIFVAPTGNNGNAGTRTAPKLTITAGLAAAVTGNKRDVLVAGGTYLEQVAITTASKGVFGGYTMGANVWSRSLATAVTVTGVNTPLSISNANNAVVQAINFIGANATGVSVPAHGGLINNSASVRLERVTLQAGSGSAGSAGVNGISGASGGNGVQGQQGCEQSGGLLCGSCGLPTGGAGGLSSCGRTGGRGGAPGNGGNFGSPGLGGVTSTGGPGTPPRNGNWPTPSLYWGQNGPLVASGINGSSGVNFGALSALGYAPAGTTPGTDGADGNGGGGGGGGGGGTTNCDSYGGAGSGGGGGGCKGTRGTAGTSGGGSFGLVLWNSTVQANTCTITAATGGNGGAGGNGSTGGGGGLGAAINPYGGSGEQDDGSNGGRGGNGSAGGSGGAGGAGGGGPSVAVARGSGAVWSAITSTLTTGGGGTGGTSPAGNGQAGLVQALY